MSDPVALARTRDDYDANAVRYAEFVDDPANTPALTTAMITTFAQTVTGPVLDAGCGPGRWTAFLHDRGLAACGVDLSPEQVRLAVEHRPDVDVRVGNVLALAHDDATFGGVLALFSLIHTTPALVPTALAEFARVTVAGGVLLVGGFATERDDWEAYDHKLSPAFRWSPDALAAAITRAGYVETSRLVVQPPPTARSASVYLFATKTAV